MTELPQIREHAPAILLPDDLTAEPLKEGIFEEIVDLTSEGIYVVDRERQILFWNAAAATISGYDAATVVGRACTDRLLRHCDASGILLCTDRCPLQAAMADGVPRSEDAFLLHHDGHRLPVGVRTAAVRDDYGRIIGAVELFHDATQPLTALEELRKARQREKLDPLTGLGNRRLIEERLRQLAAVPSGGAATAGLIFVDIDHFKQINDAHGHLVGDRVIKEVGLTIAGELQSSDIVGRWGGEEFVVISPGADVEAIAALGERMRSLVAATPIPSRSGPLAVTISLGATVMRWPERPDDVVERADGLMYASKRNGRNRLTVG